MDGQKIPSGASDDPEKAGTDADLVPRQGDLRLVRVGKIEPFDPRHGSACEAQRIHNLDGVEDSAATIHRKAGGDRNPGHLENVVAAVAIEDVDTRAALQDIGAITGVEGVVGCAPRQGIERGFFR